MISWFEKHRKLSWTITLIIAIAIFYVSSLTFAPGPPGTNFKATLYHFLAFFFLSAFLLISIAKGKNPNLILLAIAIAILYAFSDEYHQLFVPGRAGALSDVFIDLIGITFSLIIYSISLALRPIQQK